MGHQGRGEWVDTTKSMSRLQLPRLWWLAPLVVMTHSPFPLLASKPGSCKVNSRQGHSMASGTPPPCLA